MSKIYMLKHHSRQLPMGLFSDYTLAVDLAERAFRTCSITEFKHCIEEFELDPLKDKIEKGIYPWAVWVNVVTKETEITSLGTLFENEYIDYSQGKLACAYVFAPDEEEAENRALELWENSQGDEDAIKAISVFKVLIDENGEVWDVARTVAYTQKDTIKTTIQPSNDSVEVRVVADNIDEAIEAARNEYDKWIDEQLDDMPDVEEETLGN